MIKKLLLFGFLLTSMACSKTHFYAAESFQVLAKNELGVYLFLPSQSLPPGLIELGTWEFINRNKIDDNSVIRKLEARAKSMGSNVVRLEKVESKFSGEKLSATFYYHEDIAAIRYHINKLERAKPLQNCECNLVHIFRYRRKPVPEADSISVNLNGEKVADLKQQDKFDIELAANQPIELFSSESDTLTIEAFSGKEYFIELFEPNKSSSYFNDGNLGLIYQGGNTRFVNRKGILNQLRYEVYLLQAKSSES